MGKTMSAADKKILAEVVRLTQKKGLQGAVGGWKDFLKSYDGEFGSGFSDPSKRSKELLLAFLRTFKKKEKKDVKRTIRWICGQNAMVQFMKDMNTESPEQGLVRLTVEHPHYMQHFSFPFFDEKWVDIRLGEVSKAMQSNNMIAVDCEMVLCEDGTEAVVKVCVVDRNLEVKINECVNPGKAVADYRTPITGMSSEDLEGVTCCLADIQKSLKKLLSHGAILVGHSLHNDLRALKVAHLRVIDTSYIFAFAGLPTYSPSLNTLCKVVLGSPVRKEGEPHNCLHDAQAAMKLVLAKLEGDYDKPLELVGHDMPSIDLARLFLHRIPVVVPIKELQKLFAEYDAIIESDVRTRGKTYSTYAVFKSAPEANEAFNKIESRQNKDSSGRPQKEVFLKYGNGQNARLYVRRMTADVHFNGSDSSSKRPLHYENDDPGQQQAGDGTTNHKRQKTCLDPCVHNKEIEKLREDHSKEMEKLREDHSKEMEKLREELRRKEEKISNLQKALFQFI